MPVLTVSATAHIKDTLVAAGYVFGGAADWAMFIGDQPDAPDRIITLYDSAGGTPNPRWLLDYPHVQVRVRGGANDYYEVSQQALLLRNLLLGKASYDALNGNGDRIVAINAIGDVAFIGKDEQKRPEFVFNLSMIVEPAVTPETQREPL